MEHLVVFDVAEGDRVKEAIRKAVIEAGFGEVSVDTLTDMVFAVTGAKSSTQRTDATIGTIMGLLSTPPLENAVVLPINDGIVDYNHPIFGANVNPDEYSANIGPENPA